MHKPIIAVDIDDVLSRTAEAILTYSNDRWGHSHTIEDYTEHIGEMWRVGREEAELRWLEFMNSGAMEKYDVIPDAFRALTQLNTRFNLIALTSRREVLISLTTKWLNTFYPKIFNQVHSSKIYGEGKRDAHTLTKGEMLRELQADYLIDDQPKHCRGASDVGVQAILFGEYPWSRGAVLPADVVHCKNWDAVVRYFNGK